MGVLDPCSGSDNTPCKPLQSSAQARSRLAAVGFLCCIPVAKAFYCPERPFSVPRRAPRGRGLGRTSRHTLCPTIRARPCALGPLDHGVVARSLGCGKHGGYEAPGLCLPRTSVLRFVRTTPVAVLGWSHAGGGVGEECYLVDPASSHMLVSKIKPCMCNNSRANTCNKPRLLEGMHLLDKRSTRALPVAAMIHDNSTDRTALVPATHHSNFCPINFRCWTLGWAGRSASGVHRSSRPFCRRCAPGLNWPGRASGAVTLKKLECSKQAYALYTLAWDNIIGFRSYYVGLRDRTFAKDVFINQERKLGARRRSDTVLVSTINDADQGSADVAFRTPPAPYEKSKSLGSGGVWSQG
ncbi:hypothetical protein Sango_2949700 [Sesamum angolense]|uniref:Uncharacterized protein n=1 Tax=Sesamum angolense TaxID=2727404 RepID=A0AAE1VZW3_9LAMI|nr:hypothetical protein Sango_2949700 [Sesamum angolense]